MKPLFYSKKEAESNDGQGMGWYRDGANIVYFPNTLKKKGGGRIGCHEIMTGTPAIRNLIREGKTEQIQSTLQTSAKDGMFTMEKCLEGLKLKKLVE